ncbi:hypothetical protein [Nocardia otitidiscaviarum]|uniref:hypothetical protein n=1 Tax=Nocardia otitidiscaviarum TaxID=1823 RepID=UPI0018935B0E|nr:hypothetical protein [Nocardia otitidiscaviarum]MBF6180223.1 hypothetical protein [Nocardia otitidiscaviarum]
METPSAAGARRHGGRAAAVLAGAALLLTACSDSTETTVPGNSAPERSLVISSPGVLAVSDAAADQLCDMMRGDIPGWRDQGPDLGKVAFNGTVHNWALRNSGVNAAVVDNRGVVDQITTARCPDVRTDALRVLQIESLAEGLAGF